MIRLSVSVLAAALAATAQQPPAVKAAPAAPPPVTWTSGAPPATMVPNPETRPTILLWPNGAPGSEGKTGAEKYRLSADLLVVSGVNQPSLTMYLPPKEIATGAAIVVAPGGSYREIWITHEGYRVADWLVRHGIAAFVLKYRLQGDPGSGYTTEGNSLPDIQRAIRLVRSRAAWWSIDPNRVGVMGFSAGGSLAGLAGTRYGDAVKNVVDDVDKLSARPAFQALIYGTPFSGPMQAQVKFPKDMPPVFLAAGGDDSVSAKYPEIYRALKDAGVSVEMHLFAGVGHGFGMQADVPSRVAHWIDGLWEWLFDRGLLSGAASR